MKKSFAFIFITCILLVFLFSCNNAATTNTSKANYLPPFEKPLPSDLENEYAQFTQKVNEVISAKKIDKVQLASVHMFKGTYYLDSVEPDIIQKWCDLLKELKVTAVPFNPTGGSLGYSLLFYVNGKSINIGGGFGDHNIYINKSTKVMFKIDNYLDLQDDFDYLQKEMGFPKPE